MFLFLMSLWNWIAASPHCRIRIFPDGASAQSQPEYAPKRNNQFAFCAPCAPSRSRAWS